MQTLQAFAQTSQWIHSAEIDVLTQESMWDFALSSDMSERGMHTLCWAGNYHQLAISLFFREREERSREWAVMCIMNLSIKFQVMDGIWR